MNMSEGKKNISHTPKITLFTTVTSTTPSLKRTISELSPPSNQKESKKKTTVNTPNIIEMASQQDDMSNQPVNINSIIDPILQEFKSLKDTMISQRNEMSEGFKHLKSVLKDQKAEIISEINVKVDHNS